MISKFIKFVPTNHTHDFSVSATIVVLFRKLEEIGTLVHDKKTVDLELEEMQCKMR